MKEEQKQLSFLFYTSWKEQIDELDDQELRRFINNLINYHNDQEIDLPTRTEMFLWRGILPALIKNQSNWNRKRTAAIENGKKGGAPKGNDNARKQPKTTQDNLKQPKQGVKSKESSVNSQVLTVKSQESSVNSQVSSVNSQVSSVNSQLENISEEMITAYNNTHYSEILENDEYSIEQKKALVKRIVDKLNSNEMDADYFMCRGTMDVNEKLINNLIN